MHLTNDEERALNGEQGDAIATAYRILLAIGKATEASRLIPVEWAHVSGVNYNTIGDAGLEFLEEISRDGRVKIKTTINPMGFDPHKADLINDEFVEKQNRIIKAYERMNVIRSLTCIPYEVFDLPKAGTHVSFAESNAAVYVNSVAGLRTNKESALSALASSITGKAPYSALRIEELRRPSVSVRARYEFENELDYGLLGYFAGKVAENSVAFPDLKCEGRYAKALSAGIGTSGSCGMFTNDEYGEKIDFGAEEANRMKDELSTSDKGDVIIFGSPQLGLNELSLLTEMLKSKRFNKRCLIFCARKAYEDATRAGYVQKLEKAGAEVYCDCCACLTPLIDSKKVDSVVTNSIKASYYLKSWNKVDVCLKSMKEIVRDETE